METELDRGVHPEGARPHRMVKCAFCHDLMPPLEAMKGKGVCRLCRLEMAELSWRTVYDRDLRIGEIPSNLRETYRL